MAEHGIPDSDSDLSKLRKQTIKMADDLGGTLRRISLRQGSAEATVEWEDTRTDPQTAAALGPPEPAEIEPDADAGRRLLTSPMVGTFYRAPRPEADAFIEVGHVLVQGQPIGVIEAMKLFNPIVADSAGTVVEILVENAQAVEFGQALVAIDTTAEITETTEE